MPNPLQELIAAKHDEDPHRYSYGEIARRGKLPRSTVHALATRDAPTKTPRPDTLRKLAAGLDLPLERVNEAAARAAGYTVEPVDVVIDEGRRQTIDVIVVGLEQLPDHDLRRLQRMVQTFVDETSEDETD